MKILGMGIPELAIILLIVAVIAIVIIAVASASKRNGQPQAGSQNNQGSPYSTNQAQQQQPSQLGEQLTPQALEQYAQLYKDGALSKEEFEAIKARFLSE